MSIVFTGLEQEVYAGLMPLLGHDNTVRLLPAEDFLLQAPSRHRRERIVWFYRAPWSLPVTRDASHRVRAEGRLSLWLQQHRMLLRRRRVFGSQLLLVNADRADFPALCASLGLPAVVAESLAQPQWGNDRVLSAVLAQSFESSFAEHWDVFEALEALAWHAPEQLPDESKDIALSEAAVLSFLQFVLDAQALPDIQVQLAAAQAQAEQRQQALLVMRGDLEQARRKAAQEKAVHDKALAEAGRARAKVEALLMASRAETRSLLDHLHRVQEELETTHLECKDKLSAAEKQRVQMVAELSKVQAALKEQQAAASVALDKLNSEVATLKQDKSRLTAAVQEAKQKADALQSKVARNEQAVRAVEQAQLKQLRSENELMLLQMHQVQEELERYFLENRHLQQAIAQSRDSQDRARKLISHLIKASGLKPLPKAALPSVPLECAT